MNSKGILVEISNERFSWIDTIYDPNRGPVAVVVDEKGRIRTYSLNDVKVTSDELVKTISS
ncbi:MAG: hypothetical protein ACPGJV_14250 [Bacteriovoracaceae bacterium]